MEVLAPQQTASLSRDITAAPNGLALVVGQPGAGPELARSLARAGYDAAFAPDPYRAMAELSRRPLAIRALVLSLAAIHPQELVMIEVVKRRLPHLDVILTDAAGHPATLADAVRLGADAVLDADRIRRVGPSRTDPGEAPSAPADAGAEPVLSNEELRALLED